MLVVDEDAGAAQAHLPAKNAAAGQDWGPSRRVLFRFVFVYLIVYNFPISLDTLWGRIVPWAARRALGLEVTAKINGSGDQAFHYVQFVCLLALAAVAAIAWSLVDRRRRILAARPAPAHLRALHPRRNHDRLWLVQDHQDTVPESVSPSAYPAPGRILTHGFAVDIHGRLGALQRLHGANRDGRWSAPDDSPDRLAGCPGGHGGDDKRVHDQPQLRRAGQALFGPSAFDVCVCRGARPQANGRLLHPQPSYKSSSARVHLR